MNKALFKGTAVNGEVKYYRPEMLKEFLKKFEGHAVDVLFEPHNPDASRESHGYYRALNRWLSQNTESFGGWDADDIHSWAIDQCGTIYKSYPYKDGYREVKRRLSLSNISKRDMRWFMDRWIKYLATEHEIVVPEPTYLGG